VPLRLAGCSLFGCLFVVDCFLAGVDCLLAGEDRSEPRPRALAALILLPPWRVFTRRLTAPRFEMRTRNDWT
jgi:hypothetical protein